MFSIRLASLLNKTQVEPSSRASAFTEADQKRLQKLEEAYSRNFTTPKPIYWELDEKKRPVYFKSSSNFRELAGALSEEILAIEIPNASLCHSVRGIFTTLSKLSYSLSKRLEKKLREGSVEEMFFTHLIGWLSQFCLQPFDKITSPQILETFIQQSGMDKFIKYCEEVSDTVFLPESSKNLAKRNNPLTALAEVMINLNTIRNDIEGLCQANSHPKLVQIENTVQHMAAQILKTLNLMIKGDHQFAPDLEVIPFMNEGQIHRPRINTFRNLRLGQWLYKTLSAVGIKTNNYAGNSAHPPLSFPLINHHLEGECINDNNCKLPSKMQENISDDRWGHWEVTLGETTAEIQKLRYLRNLHKDILKAYYLLEMIKEAKTLDTDENWLFNHPQGIKITSALTRATQIIMGQCFENFANVWNSFYQAIQNKKQKGAVQPDTPIMAAFDMGLVQKNNFENQSKKLQIALSSINDQFAAIDLTQIKYEESVLTPRLKEFLAHFEIPEPIKEVEIPKATIPEGTPSLYPSLSAEDPVLPNSVAYSSPSAPVISLEPIFTPPQQAMAGYLPPLPPLPPPIFIPPAPVGFNALLNKKLKKSMLPFTQVAEALFSHNPKDTLPASVRDTLVMDEVLLAPNTRFHDPLHRTIYEKFLVANKNAMKRHSIFSIGWIPREQMPQFRHLYVVVNTLLKYLYAPNPPGHENTELLFLDLQLVNLFLLQAMSTYNNYYYESNDFKEAENLLKDALLQYKDNGDNTLTISMNRKAGIEEQPNEVAQKPRFFPPKPVSKTVHTTAAQVTPEMN